MATSAQEDLRLAGRRATILARILSYDANLVSRAGSSVDVALLFKRGDKDSEQTAELIRAGFDAIRSAKVGGLGLTIQAVAFQSGPQLDELIVRRGIDAVVLVGGLDAEIGTIKQVTRRRLVLSMGNDESQVSKGISVALVEEDAKLTIYVNLSQSKEEGVSFSPDMLRLAKVIR